MQTTPSPVDSGISLSAILRPLRGRFIPKSRIRDRGGRWHEERDWAWFRCRSIPCGSPRPSHGGPRKPSVIGDGGSLVSEGVPNPTLAGDSPQPRSSYWMNAVAPTCSFSTSGAARKVWQMPNMRQCRIGVRTRCQAESQMVGNSDDNFQSDLYRRHVWHVQRASGRSSTLHR